jgi:uncharacterized protein YndB with AHSA1/START domain
MVQLIDRGVRKRIVESRVIVAADRAECWRFLIGPELLGQWFADSRPGPGGKVDLHFGDGDFFRVSTRAVNAPTRLRWDWQFMGVGAGSEIEFLLTEEDKATTVAVKDEGEYSESGVRELEEGWADFLSRLRRRIETGLNSRYQWSETIGASIVVGAEADTVMEALRDRGMWSRHLPGVKIEIAEADNGIDLELHGEGWAGATTTARLRLCPAATGLHVKLSHEGWLQLPEACRIGERRKAAEQWARALAELETMLMSPEVARPVKAG